jgi:hypothetical protein
MPGKRPQTPPPEVSKVVSQELPFELLARPEESLFQSDLSTVHGTLLWATKLAEFTCSRAGPQATLNCSQFSDHDKVYLSGTRTSRSVRKSGIVRFNLLLVVETSHSRYNGFVHWSRQVEEYSDCESA